MRKFVIIEYWALMYIILMLLFCFIANKFYPSFGIILFQIFFVCSITLLSSIFLKRSVSHNVILFVLTVFQLFATIWARIFNKIQYHNYLGFEPADAQFYHDIGTRIYLDYGKQEKYLAVRKENLVYASDYLELAQYYRKQKNEKLALQIVKEGLEKAQGGLSEIYRYLFEYYKNRKEEAELEKLYKSAKKRKQNLETLTELMYQYYKENGNYSKKKETLFCLMEGSYLDWKKLYERCVRELTKEDFEKEEVHILEKIKKNDLSTYFDIELEKGKTKELLQYLKKTGSMGGFYGIDREHYFSKRLEKVYPRDIVELYWQETERYVSWGKRENYQAAVGNLAVISRMMKENHWEEEWKQRYQDFKEKNKRKRLLMELL